MSDDDDAPGGAGVKDPERVPYGKDVKPLKHIMRMGPLPASLEALVRREELSLHSPDADGAGEDGYLCAFVPSGETVAKVSAWRADPRHHTTPVIALVDDPSDDDFLPPLVAGADDLLMVSDLGGARRRLAALASRGPVRRSTDKGTVLLIDADEGRRRRLGRPLFRSGLDVEFASTLGEIAGKRADVAVIHESCGDAGFEDVHNAVRAMLGLDDLPVVVVTEPTEGQAHGGRRVERTATIPANVPADHLLFVVNELLNPAPAELRSSPRLLHASLCTFRPAGVPIPRFGVTFNISRGGVFVRTLDLPELGESVWVEFRPPSSDAAVHLRGTVAWRTLGGGTPPGFAVQLLAHRCPSDDLAMYRERYQWLLDSRGGLVIEDTPQMRSSNPPAQDARVLIADDEPGIRKQLARVFRDSNIEVTTAADGREAVDCFRRDRHDVVIADINMPELDGISLLKAIRADDEEVPVIMTTGAPALETALEAMEHGALRYLVKPFQPDEVRRAVTDAIGMARLAKFRRQAAMVGAASAREVDEVGDLDETLTRAIKQLYAHYQPIVRWPDQEIVAFEALARTSEPKVPHPGVLFDAAERLDRLREVGRKMRALTPEPFAERSERLFINLHPADLLDEDLYDPRSPLAALGDRVVLEITERASLNGVGDLRKRVDRLRELGFRVAVDDLGAGYAGLSAFCALQPDVVKLDMSIVRDVHESDTKKRLIGSMVGACQELGIDVIAEGVECMEELEALRELGCELFQGFFFARPALPFPDVNWPA